MPRFLVAHPHRGADGQRRTPGEVVQIGADEAAVRSRDGFGRIVTAAEAVDLEKAAAAETGSLAAASTQQGPPPPPEASGDQAPQPPKMSAPKTEWVDYLAKVTSRDTNELTGMTRGELIELARTGGTGGTGG